MKEQDMPIGFGNDPCDDCVHWLKRINENRGNGP